MSRSEARQTGCFGAVKSQRIAASPPASAKHVPTMARCIPDNGAGLFYSLEKEPTHTHFCEWAPHF